MAHTVSSLSDGCTKAAGTMGEAKIGREIEGTTQVSVRSGYAGSLKDGGSGMIMAEVLTKSPMSLLKPGPPDLGRRSTTALKGELLIIQV